METNFIRSAKRTNLERSGIYSWHSYYAGFSEAVVEDLLDHFLVRDNQTVLDPWLGSGTSAVVCQKRGIPFIGREINPVMVLFAKAKNPTLLNYDLRQIGREIIENCYIINPKSAKAPEGFDQNWFLLLKSLEDNIITVVSSLSYSKSVKELIQAFFYSALFQVIRISGPFQKGSNPTWIKKTLKDLDINNTIEVFLSCVEKMLHDLFDTFTGDRSSNIDVNIGDSRQLDISNYDVDCIITSPPYLTRIDYAVATKPELQFIGDSNYVNELRRATMGAPIIRKDTPASNCLWGNTCYTFLEDVRRHKSKAASSYYLKNYLQYFDDAYTSLAEMKRVLKSNGKAALVIQTSYFKELLIDLPRIYVEMGESLGMKSNVISSYKVTQHMAHVNIRSSNYVKNKIFREEIVMLEKGEQFE